MPVAGFYYTYGDDSSMIEKKWLPDLQKKYPDAEWIRLDASIDDISVPRLVTEYNVNDLFSKGKVIVIRNADTKHAQVESLAEEILNCPVPANALVLICGGWNKTTRLGKLAKKSFIVREFAKPEVKPFDLLDYLNSKNSAMVLKQTVRLFDADYNPLAMFSLIFGHFLLLRQIYERRHMESSEIAREIKQHSYRVKKAMTALRYWTGEDLDEALKELGKLDSLLRTWQYDEKMIIQMSLIKLCL